MICSVCKCDLSLSAFNRSGEGYQSMCRHCNKIYQAAYRGRVTSKSIFKTTLRLTAYRLSMLRRKVDVPPDVNALALLTGVRGIHKNDPFAIEVRQAVDSLWGNDYNSTEHDVDHIIAYRFYSVINPDGTANIAHLFKAANYRNIQVLTKCEHALKTAAEWYQQQPVLTPAQRLDLVDLLP